MPLCTFAKNEAINAKIGDMRSDADFQGDHGKFFPPLANVDDNEHLDNTVKPVDPTLLVPESNEFDHNVYNGYIQAEVRIMRNGVKQAGKVVAWRKGDDNQPIGKGHSNPLLETCEYIVNFTNSLSEAYSANIIAESIFVQVNEGEQTL